MIPEFAHYALILALCLALIQSIVPLWGAQTNRVLWMQTARFTSIGQVTFISFAFFALAYAFVSNDFSVAYVAQNSHTQLPFIYRFCAVWGAHEGSLLLWVFILSIWMAAIAIFSQQLPLDIISRVLAVLGMISTGFLLFLLTTSNPFLRYLPNFPSNGQDLNPLLQDPGLVSHPPMLYTGYVGFSVVFAFAIAALISGRFDSAWARWSKPWTVLAWCFLTLGIVLGSWWAYRELGWGGWWFWDPVENASFLPWLSGTALLHSLAVTEKRDAFKAWTALLAICTFSLSLMGTFIVRSGVLVSVHAFAVDSQRGIFVLIFLSLVVGGSLLLYAWRAQSIRNEIKFSLYSRETLLLTNNVLLMVMMLSVLLGTLYPLIIDALGLDKISVGPPYFNTIFIPLMSILLAFMGLAASSRWQKTDYLQTKKTLWLNLITAVFFAVALILFYTKRIDAAVLLGLCLAFWVVLPTLQMLFKYKRLSRPQYAMIIAHLGLAISVMGVVLTSHYSIQRELRMTPGEVALVGPYQFKFLGTRDLVGPNYSGVEAGILISRGNKVLELLRPEQRIYQVQRMALAKTAITRNLFRDLYVALGEALDHNAWSLRIYYKPFVCWIWWGGLLMVCGGLLAVINRRKNQIC
jgi:cytochrome c-type biogenesis protein CcmF